MRLLFVCGRNRLRSPTAERIFSGVGGHETASAGVAPDAETPLDDDLIAWADIIFVMEESHRRKLSRSFGSRVRDKKVVCLGIPDEYEYMDALLIERLWERVPRSVPGLESERPNSGE